MKNHIHSIIYMEKFPEIVQSSISTLIFREPKKHLYLLAYLFSHHPIYKSLKGQMKMSKVLFTSSPFCVRSPLIGDQNRGEDLKCHWDFSTATELLSPPLGFFRVSKWSNSVKIVQSQKYPKNCWFWKIRNHWAYTIGYLIINYLLDFA